MADSGFSLEFGEKNEEVKQIPEKRVKMIVNEPPVRDKKAVEKKSKEKKAI